LSVATFKEFDNADAAIRISTVPTIWFLRFALITPISQKSIILNKTINFYVSFCN